VSTPVPASEVYTAGGEDRAATPLKRAAQWAGTALVSLFDASGAAAPAMTDIVIRLTLDGTEVRRFEPADMEDVEAILEMVERDLATLDAVDFADAWLD